MTFSQGRGFVAAALFVSGLVACKSSSKDAGPLAAERVVIKTGTKEGAAPGPDASQREARAQADYQAAEAAWRAGDALTALSIANHAILEGVPREMEAGFRDLRAQARAAVVATKICRVRAVPDKDVAADGESVGVKIEFANLANTQLSVPRAQAGSSAAAVVLTFVREDFDVFGNSRRSEFTVTAPVQKDLVLDPGRTEETRLVVPQDMTRLTHDGFSVIELTGVFRPVSMRVGDSEFFDAVPIDAAKFRVFQKGFEQLAADPLTSLKRAVLKRSPPHVLAAAELLAPSDRAEAKTFLEAARAKDPDMGTVIDASLARLSAVR